MLLRCFKTNFTNTKWEHLIHVIYSNTYPGYRLFYAREPPVWGCKTKSIGKKKRESLRSSLNWPGISPSYHCTTLPRTQSKTSTNRRRCLRIHTRIRDTVCHLIRADLSYRLTPPPHPPFCVFTRSRPPPVSVHHPIRKDPLIDRRARVLRLRHYQVLSDSCFLQPSRLLFPLSTLSTVTSHLYE